jgi:hypothetical protein
MPNRILYEKICVSDTLALLSGDEERFFYRLMVQCDDFGRCDARPSFLRARCFSVMLDSVSDAMVAQWLVRLVEVGLAETYIVKGRPYLVVLTWDTYQQRRAKRSKYPEPDLAGACTQMPAGAGIGPRIRYPGTRNEERGTNSLSDATREPQAAVAPAKAKAQEAHPEQISDTMATSDSREPQQNRHADGGGAETGEAGPGATPDLTKNRPASRHSAVGAGLNRRKSAPSGLTPPPESLQPDDVDYAAGAEVGLTREQVATKTAAMLDHFRGKGELRADWHATLRNWLRNAPKYDQPARASPSSRNGIDGSIYGDIVTVEGIKT